MYIHHSPYDKLDSARYITDMILSTYYKHSDVMFGYALKMGVLFLIQSVSCRSYKNSIGWCVIGKHTRFVSRK